MSHISLYRNKIALIGFLFLAIVFTGCATNSEVKGGGTIIGNPTLPSLPAVPETRDEYSLQQDCAELLAEVELKRLKWTFFMPATLTWPIDPFVPLAELGIMKYHLDYAFNLYLQNNIWGNLLAGL